MRCAPTRSRTHSVGSMASRGTRRSRSNAPRSIRRPRKVPAAVKGANERLLVGLIGCGGRGGHDAGLFQKTDNVEVTAVCDVDEGRRRLAAKGLGVASGRAFDDMRRLLDDDSIDAVIVATPDHWHSPASILACDAGKHVYVEKPISHNVREGRLLVEASKRQGG